MLLLVAAALALLPAAPPASAAPGKPRAPVTLTATLGAGSATVTARFGAAATDVRIEVHGVDGLTVTRAATPPPGGRFSRGEVVTFNVAFQEGAGPGQVVVAVAGAFGGARQFATASFPTRPAALAPLERSAPATVDSTGRRVKVMPSGAR